MKVVFTDLDGTLLDRDTYAWEAARPALDELERAGVPVVFATSKTRAETEWWRRQMGNRHPFVIENGGAAVVPCGYFGERIPGAHRDGAYDIVELGAPYPQLLSVLHAATAECHVEMQAFHNMTAGEIAAVCGLPLQLASLAKLRWYDEPFRVVQGSPCRLAEAIARRGKRCSEGGRFHHITGTHDKLTAVQVLRGLYARAHGNIWSMGIGDHWNDIPFLNAMDAPVLMDPPEALLAAIPRAAVASPAGPRAWSETVMRLLAA